MKIIVKIEEEDVGTFLLGKEVGIRTQLVDIQVGIRTQLVDILFSTDAMEKLITNYETIVRSKKREPIKELT